MRYILYVNVESSSFFWLLLFFSYSAASVENASMDLYISNLHSASYSVTFSGPDPSHLPQASNYLTNLSRSLPRN